MAAPDPFVDPKAGRLIPEPPENGWDLAQRRHHLALHGLIPWDADIAPGRAVKASPTFLQAVPDRLLCVSLSSKLVAEIQPRVAPIRSWTSAMWRS